MTLFETISERIRAIFRREPEDGAWLLPGNEVTRAVESGRNLAAYDERMAPPQAVASQPRPALELDTLMTESPPALTEPAKKIIISDDAVHAPLAAAPRDASEKPLEAKSTRKRWWRRAA